MALTDEQIERYSRHIILKEVGAKGQKKLLNAKVLIIGAGGLGAPAAMYLGAAGVGTIGIADADEVDLSNLQRQIIHQTADVGKAKVQSAKETINAMNPDVEVRTYREFITSENIMDIIADYDFILILSLMEADNPVLNAFRVDEEKTGDKRGISNFVIKRKRRYLPSFFYNRGGRNGIFSIYDSDAG